MPFNTPVFVFLYLPLVLALDRLLPRSFRNLFLLAASLFFYAWGEQEVVLVMLLVIAGNYLLALWVEGAGARTAKRVVALTVAFNLAVLVFYKYFHFIAENLTRTVGWPSGELPAGIPTVLPIGISFFTFQALSYVIDVHRRDVGVERNAVDFALYIALFPQLVAGPIVRYRQIAEQIHRRIVRRPEFADGIRRFVVGLGKKVLIADTVAVASDAVFGGVPLEGLSAGVAWLGIVCFTLEIYFDFSGYSDMAIGLGRMLGMRYPENFDFPYVSRSLTEFWRRWHISLSTWFRDYLYIPLGGNRTAPWKVWRNLVVVFFLCGLWHGASWGFVVWGLYHGCFLIVERTGARRWLDARPGWLRHAYVLLVVMVGWVFFRAPTLPYAVGYVGSLFGLGAAANPTYALDLYLRPDVAAALAAGALGSAPLWAPLGRWMRSLEGGGRGLPAAGLRLTADLALVSVFVLSLSFMSAQTQNPFIYFRF